MQKFFDLINKVETFKVDTFKGIIRKNSNNQFSYQQLMINCIQYFLNVYRDHAG